MTIFLSDAGKRFNRDWIFRKFTYTFHSGNSYAITGANGSGKSTLLQAISGSTMLSEGKIDYKKLASISHNNSYNEGTGNDTSARKDSFIRHNDRMSAQENFDRSDSIKEEDIYQHVSICAPYLELVEEMTVREFLSFHEAFKKLLPGISIEQIIDRVGLSSASDKQIRNYSSGMKQRVKLAQCIFSDTSMVLLDEPCTNLDASGIALYHQLIQEYCKERLVIVSSNDEIEYNFCNEIIAIGDYK